ncbi:MAG: TonB-dependent receptor [Candidatus Omnitrophica bacterium]|nr:TonB-dependent receptor [Candidatus Omnitrophota bacterium]
MLNKPMMIIVLSLFFAAKPAFAQSAAPPQTELALFEEIPTVYSASRMEEDILEAPAAISVITSTDLNEWGIIDTPDAFRRIPGVDVIAFDGRTWGVSARGFTERFSRRMLVLLDGMSIYTPLFSGVIWDFIPLLVDEIDKIEILRGPNDTLYGFNAFNGVININTKEPGDTAGVFGKYIYSNFGKNEFIGRYGDNIDLGSAGDIDFRMAYSYDMNRGYGDDHGRDYSDSEQVQIATSRIKYNATDAFDVDFIFGINYGPRNISAVAQNSTPAKQFPEMDFQILKFNYDINPTHSGYLQMYRWGINRDVKRLSNGIPNDDYRERQYDIEFQDSFDLFGGRSSTVWGASYRHNTVESFQVKRELSDNVRQSAHDDLWSAFINEKMVLLEDRPLVEKLTLVAGVRAEWSHLTRRTQFAPRASLLYEPVRDNVFRATYARGYRLPSFYEEYATNFVPSDTGNVLQLLGNRQLKTETVDSFEIGYSARFMDGKLHVDADTFYSFYKGMVQTFQSQAFSAVPPQPRIVDFNNASRARSSGVELAATYRPWEWLSLYANYTYLTIADTRGGTPTTSLFQGASPDNKANLGGTLKLEEDTIMNMPYLGGSWLNVNANFRDAYVYFNDADSPRSEFDIKKHWRLDFCVGKSFFDDGLEVTFSGQNVLGENFEAGFVQVPQIYYFTVTLKKWPWQMLEWSDNEEY